MVERKEHMGSGSSTESSVRGITRRTRKKYGIEEKIRRENQEFFLLNSYGLVGLTSISLNIVRSGAVTAKITAEATSSG